MFVANGQYPQSCDVDRRDPLCPLYVGGLNGSRGRGGALGREGTGLRHCEGSDCLKIVGFLTPMRDRSFRDVRQMRTTPNYDIRRYGSC